MTMSCSAAATVSQFSLLAHRARTLNKSLFVSVGATRAAADNLM
jgi:hypothetical protein